MNLLCNLTQKNTNMKKIRFVLFEDDKEHFQTYSNIINDVFDELEVKATQILPEYEDTNALMSTFRKYKKDIAAANSALQREVAEKIAPSQMDIIYFIDDNWTNKSGNQYGRDFFKEFLLNKQTDNAIDAIALTVSTDVGDYNGMQYVYKHSSTVKEDIMNKITNTSVYKRHMGILPPLPPPPPPPPPPTGGTPSDDTASGEIKDDSKDKKPSEDTAL